MAEQKTKKTEVSVEAFLNGVADVKQRADALRLAAMMQEITGESPKMWGPTMIGFGDYHYVYESGREGDIFRVGFSPRKSNLVLYGMGETLERLDELVKKLGKVKTTKGCVYIKKLDDVDLAILRKLIQAKFEHLADTEKIQAKPAAAKKPRKPQAQAKEGLKRDVGK
jgi:hypothetical protein